MEIDRKRLKNASKNKPFSGGGLNIPEIKTYLRLLANTDKKQIEQINNSSRPELNKLLKAALKIQEVETATHVDVKTNPKLPLVVQKPEVKTGVTVDVKTNPRLPEVVQKPEVKAVAPVDVKTNPRLPLAVKKPEVKTATPVDVKTNPKLPLFAEIADVLRKNPIIQTDLNSLILKYFKPSIKVEYRKGKISYLTQPEITEDDNEPQFREYLWKYDYETRSFIMDLDICGILELTDPVAMFEKSQIRKINGHVILIGSTAAMFEQTANFEGGISKWDTSKVTNMQSMFTRATFFNQDLSGWDTSQVTDMDSMFLGATSFDQDLSGWNLSKVENVDHMFDDATKFRGKIKQHRGKYQITYDKNQKT